MSNKSNKSNAISGITIGVVIAIVLSWATNQSVFWCIVHAFCSWLYIIYWLLFHSI